MTYCCQNMRDWSEAKLIHWTKRGLVAGLRPDPNDKPFVVIAYCPFCGKATGIDPSLAGTKTQELI